MQVGILIPACVNKNYDPSSAVEEAWVSFDTSLLQYTQRQLQWNNLFFFFFVIFYFKLFKHNISFITQKLSATYLTRWPSSSCFIVYTTQNLSITEQHTALEIATQDHISMPVSETISFVTASFWSERIWTVIYIPSHKTEEDKIWHKTDSKHVD